MAELVEGRWDWNSGDTTKSKYTQLAEVEWEAESYQFNITRVYVEIETGKLFYATDTGCSCPSPFEDTTTDELTPVMKLQDWYDHVNTRVVANKPDDDAQYPYPTPASAIDDAETARKAIEAHLKKVGS